MYRNFLTLVLFVSYALMLPGCQPTQAPSEEAATLRGNPGSQTPAAGGREWFLFIAEGLDKRIYDEFKPELTTLLDAAHEGDVIHVVAAARHNTVATIEVPKGNHRTRIRNRHVSQGMSRIAEFLRKAPQEKSSVGQLQVSVIPESIQSLTQTKGPITIIAIGDPIYNDPKNPTWAMIDGLVISDASIRSRKCPFGQAGRMPHRGGCDIHFVAPAADWGDSAKHRLAVQRFYSLYLSEAGAAFYGISADLHTTFRRASKGQELALLRSELGNDPYIGMWQTRRKTIIGVATETVDEVPVLPIPTTVSETTAVEAPKAVEDKLSTAADKGGPLGVQDVAIRMSNLPDAKTAISIRWEYMHAPRGNDADLDLRIADRKDGSELSYFKMRTGFGQLFRDVRHVVSNQGDFTSWEYAEIDHDRIADLDVWIDAFHVTGPVKCQMRAVWHKMTVEHEITFKIDQGDRAAQQHARESSPAWRRVPLAELFQANKRE